MEDGVAWSKLTASERERFDRDGFLVIDAALDPQRLAILRALATRLENEYYAPAGPTTVARRRWPMLRRNSPTRPGPRPVPLGRNVEFHDVLHEREVLDLVDLPSTLSKVSGMLGWNISVYLATVMITPPDATRPDIAEHVAGGWHQDSSRVNLDLNERPRPRLSVKLAFFLTDTSAPDCGNLWIVPGSHRHDSFPDNASSAMPLQVPAGTCVMFDRRLWHSASPNHSTASRQVVFIGYAYRWLQRHDDMDVAPLITGSDPLRRQLLGWAPDATSRYAPDDEDVPLKALLADPAPSLTDRDRQQLSDRGFVRLPDRLPPQLVLDLRGIYSRAWQDEEEENTERLHLLRYDTFRRLIDDPVALAGPRGVFGEHLQLLDLWLNYQPGADSHEGSRPDRAVQRDWHRDLTHLADRPRRPLMMNMLVFLDDVTDDVGPTRVFPASHRQHQAPVHEHDVEPHPDEVAVPLEAGEILLFDSTLVHSRGLNRSAGPRRGIALLWGYWFVKPTESTLPLCPAARIDADESRLRILGLRQPTIDQYLFEPF